MILKRNKNSFIIVATSAILLFSFGVGFSLKSINTKNFNADTIINHGILPEYNKEQLASTSPFIIEGTVSKIHPAKWNSNDGKEPSKIDFADTVYHDVAIKVDNVIKGIIDNKDIIVRIYGGEVPDSPRIKKVEFEGSAEYALDEKVILFLDYDDSSYKKSKDSDHYVTRGMIQGKWSVKNGIATNEKESYSVQGLKDVVGKYKDYKWPKPVEPKSIEK